MDKKHRERGDNWTTEEKEIFMKIMKESTVIIEDKRTDTNSNNRKDVELEEASFLIDDVVIDDINSPNNEIILKRTAHSTEKGNMENHIPAKKLTTLKNARTESDKTKTHKAGASHKNIILENNLEFKEKTFKLMEEEYALKIAYQKQELCQQELRHKFEIDILMLEKEKKAMELNMLKKKNNII